MIVEFADSWSLFRDAYLAGWFLAVALAMIGVLVVARNQIFIGAAVSQASALGIAFALRLGDAFGIGRMAWIRSDAFLSAAAVLGSVLAALATAHRRGRGRAGHEALTGWVFLLASSLAILIVSHSAHGTEEVHRLLASTLIGATTADVWLFGGLALVSAAVLLRFHRPLLLLTFDAQMAAAVGVPVAAWTTASVLWLGLVVGLGIRCAGVLYSFGCLVLPAMAAANLCREMRSMLVVAPAIALGAAVAGFVVAHHQDYPPAQLTVALLCLVVLLTGIRGWGVGPR